MTEEEIAACFEGKPSSIWERSGSAGEFDRKCEIVENALYRLKERDHVTASEVKALDDLLACPAVVKIDLYDLIRFHDIGIEGPPGFEVVSTLRSEPWDAERFRAGGERG
jgi:hypothetical protein